MPSKRLARLNEQLKREISSILRTEVRDPRVGLVTITAVDVVADLAVAKVYVRAMGSEEEQAHCLDGLRAAAPFIRRELGKQLHVRRVPELRFRLDRSLEHAQRIESLLAEVAPHGTEDTGGADEGSSEDGEDE